MGCNCGGGTAVARYELRNADGTSGGLFLTRTEAVAALSVAPAGSTVVSKSP